MRPFIILILFALPVVAAPVPKALKTKATMDGVWEWVEFNGDDGKMGYTIQKPSYWRIEGDRISTGKRSIEEALSDKLAHTLCVRDEQQPHLRTYDAAGIGNKFSAVMELDGDTLRWCYATDRTKTITECKPANGVYFYVFKRVKEEK